MTPIGLPGLTPEASPRRLLDLFGRHPEAHPYGLADLDEPFWSRSRWWMAGEAAVGEVGLGDGVPPAIYAISVADPAGTLALLTALDHELPERYTTTAPVGVAAHLAPLRAPVWSEPHTKMVLTTVEALDQPDPRTRRLSPADAPAVEALLATNTDPGAFFHPSLLESGHYQGRWSGDPDRPGGATLVAVAGVHVVSRHHGVAAIGNVVTHPEHRRQGLARSVVSSVARQLRTEVATVGLNVISSNTGAIELYRHLGFEPVMDYDEALLVRSS